MIKEEVEYEEGRISYLYVKYVTRCLQTLEMSELNQYDFEKVIVNEIESHIII